MQIVLWVILVHVIELAGIAFYLLIRKNQKLEQIVLNQQQTIDTISILTSKMDDSFKQLDGRIWVGEDEDLKTMFDELKEVQSILSSLK
jgi:CHASE3 domain sensor protein